MICQFSDFLNENILTIRDVEIGDKVICIDNKNDIGDTIKFLTIGKSYEIIDIIPRTTGLDSEDCIIIIGDLGDLGDLGDYGQHRCISKLKRFVKETEEMKKRKEEIRTKYLHIDPYGEEEWKNTNESKKFKINDRVTCIDNDNKASYHVNKYLPLSIGKEYMVYDTYKNYILIRDDNRNLFYYSKDIFVKYKEYERFKKKKDEIKQKMIDSGIDPYGEDDWLD